MENSLSGRAGIVSRPQTEAQASSPLSVTESTDSRRISCLDAGNKTSKEIMKLVQRLFISTGAAVPQVVVVAGIEQGSGCSWVCGQIAEFMTSHLDRSVCLVDADPRSAPRA